MAAKVKTEAVATGMLTAGKVEWDDQTAFTTDLKTLTDGPIIASIERASHQAIRSIKANKYYRGKVLKEMAKETGQPQDDIHDAMCARFLARTVLIVNKHTGEVSAQHAARRSSRLQSDEFYEFVENVRLFAQEFLGLNIEDPDPFWRERSA